MIFMRLERRKTAEPFFCVECKKTKKAKLVARSEEGDRCNGCYGQMLAEGRGYAS